VSGFCCNSNDFIYYLCDSVQLCMLELNNPESNVRTPVIPRHLSESPWMELVWQKLCDTAPRRNSVAFRTPVLFSPSAIDGIHLSRCNGFLQVAINFTVHTAQSNSIVNWHKLINNNFSYQWVFWRKRIFVLHFENERRKILKNMAWKTCSQAREKFFCRPL